MTQHKWHGRRLIGAGDKDLVAPVPQWVKSSPYATRAGYAILHRDGAPHDEAAILADASALLPNDFYRVWVVLDHGDEGRLPSVVVLCLGDDGNTRVLAVEDGSGAGGNRMLLNPRAVARHHLKAQIQSALAAMPSAPMWEEV